MEVRMFLTKTKRSRYYQIIYFKDGKQTSKSTYATSRKKAEIILEAFQRSVLELPGIPHVGSSPRLKKFEEEYIEMISLSCSRGYLIRSVKPAFKHISLYFGNVHLGNIKSIDAERFLFDHYKKAKHSAVLYHRVLKAAFTKAIIWGYTETNPFKGIRLPKIQWKAPVFITVDELKKIIDNTEKQVFKDLFQFAFFTGMRSAEIMNLKWNQVNLEDNKIQIGSDEFNTKSRKIRFIPIAEPIKHILIGNNLNSHNNGKSFVFSKGKYENYNRDYISKKFKKSVREAGLSEEIHFHTLRASFGSLLLQKGIPISSISKLLGHSSILVTERHYTELRLDNLYSAISSFNDIQL